MREFDPAIAMLVEDRPVLGRVHLNRGNVHLQRTTSGRGGADFAAPSAPARGRRRRSTRPRPRTTSATSDCSRGDLVAALETWTRRAPAFAAEGPVMAAISDQDRAEVLLAAGLVDEGRRAAARPRAPTAARRLHQRQGEAELALARALAMRTDPARPRACAARRPRRFSATRVAGMAAPGRGRASSRPRSSAARLARLLGDAPTLVARGAAPARRHPRGRRALRLRVARWRRGRARPESRPRGRRGAARRDPARVRLLPGTCAPSSQAAPVAPGRARRTCGAASTTCTRGRARSAGSTCRPTWSGTASGWRCAGWRWPWGHGRTRCCSSGRSGPGCWPRGSSRCGRRRTRRPRRTWPSCGPGRRRSARPSCGGGCGSGPGSTRAPVRSRTRWRSTSCRPRWARTPHWSPTS